MAYEPELKELTYDLRQTYAEILTEVLRRISFSRVNRKYIDWFNALDDLYIEIYQKLTEDEDAEYHKELEKTVLTLNLFQSAYKGQDEDNDHIFKIQTVLKQLEKWLKKKMDDHHMFGTKEYEDGL